MKLPGFGGWGGVGGGTGVLDVVVVDDEEALVDVEYWLNVVWNCCWFVFGVDVVVVAVGVGVAGCVCCCCCWMSKRVNGICRFCTIKSTNSCFSVHVWWEIFFACK